MKGSVTFDVEAARRHAQYRGESSPDRVLLAACDEIERLQAFVDLGRRAAEQADELAEQRVALNAEIERLRRVLSRIENKAVFHDGNGKLVDIARTARAALEEKP